MSLWTPYAEKALDLSRPVKHERSVSPARSPQDYKRRLVYQYDATSPRIGYAYRQHCVPAAAPAPGAAVSPECVSWSPPPQSPQSPDLYDLESISEDVEYQAFERDALRAFAERNGGSLLGNNPRMRRAVQTSHAADDSYRKQRERNNVAAKQSRDRRKLREVRLAFQVSFLKKKLAGLRARLALADAAGAAGAERCCARCQQQCHC